MISPYNAHASIKYEIVLFVKIKHGLFISHILNICYNIMSLLNTLKKTALDEDFMKLAGIEGSIYDFHFRRGAKSSGHYFQDGRHFSKWRLFW